MTRSVIVTTPIPTLEEFGKALGLSKARQKAIMRIMMESKTVRSRSAAAKGGAVNSYRRKTSVLSTGKTKSAASGR